MEKLWFKRKRFGFGWTPATKEGWIVTITAILLIISSGTILNKNPFLSVTYILLIITALIATCYQKGEKPAWQWGKK